LISEPTVERMAHASTIVIGGTTTIVIRCLTNAPSERAAPFANGTPSVTA
jgi:hypothetical protein